MTTYYLMDGHVRSFRDPAGAVLEIDGRILRRVRNDAMPTLQTFLASQTARSLFAQGRLPATQILPASFELPQREGFTFLEHERIPFATFPSEWPAEMLHAAAVLTLDIAEALLPEGLGLKDATPLNILWRGCEPVFIDLLSFESRNPVDATWLPLAQFERTFLLPLMANAAFGLPLDQVFQTRRDGLDPEDLYRLAGPLQKLTPPFLTRISLPVWLTGKAASPGVYHPHLSTSPEKARYILSALFARQRRELDRLKPQGRRVSTWSGYATHKPHYQLEQAVAKTDFLREAFSECKPRRVLDLGCNTGDFSVLAAQSGATVVAADGDAVVVGAAFERARREKLPILPMVLNVARPTPAMGWRNRESPAFLSRAEGYFDGVLMLALMHHLLVSERIPMDEILRLAGDLTTGFAIIEFVGSGDEMFQVIARGRDHLHADATRKNFEQSCLRYFEIVRAMPLPASSRVMYLLRKRANP